MRIATTLALLPVLLGLPACGFDGSDEEFANSGELRDDPMASVPSEPEGETDPVDETEPVLLLTCDLEMPCALPLELVRETGSFDQSYADNDLCILKALADGTKGLVQTVAAFPASEAYLDHVLVGSGEVLRQVHGRSDSRGWWHKPSERCTLQTSSFFTACLAGFDPACLDPDRWVLGCEPVETLVCPAG